MKYVFGPVLSRRLGQSLGIDVVPYKTCDWNCVYCQLGKTDGLTCEPKVYAPLDGILEEVRIALRAPHPKKIDWITVTGSGEPLLNSDIGELIRSLKKETGLPIAFITNGSLLFRSRIRDSIVLADAVLPTLDAGTSELYRVIHRPHPEITFENHVEGLIKFRGIYKGKLWLEVMLISGVNDTDEALRDIAKILDRVRADEVHINTPVRIPAQSWVKTPTTERLERAKALFGPNSSVVQSVEGGPEFSVCENLLDAVVDVVTRHPMSQLEVERTLTRWDAGRVQEALSRLEATGKIRLINRGNTSFWASALFK